MASITLTIPDPIAVRVLNGFAYSTGYQDTVFVDGVEEPNPESKINYSKRILGEWIKKQVVAYEVSAAVSTAASNTRATSESEITIS